MTIITVIDVTVTATAGKGGKRGYSVAEVVHTDDKNQGARTKRLVSFSNPQTFDALKDAKKGDQFEITLAKEGDFWQWTSAKPVSGGVSSGSPQAETPTYRTQASISDARRQILIVRQSSLAQAVAFYDRGQGDAPEVEDVLNVANQFAAWVLDETPPKLEEMPDDIPF